MTDIITRDIDSNLNIRVCQETCDTSQGWRAPSITPFCWELGNFKIEGFSQCPSDRTNARIYWQFL